MKPIKTKFGTVAAHQPLVQQAANADFSPMPASGTSLVFDFADVEPFQGFAFTPAEGQIMAQHGAHAELADFAPYQKPLLVGT